MGLDRKYGRVNFATENKIGHDEPVFVIRAQDAVAVNAIWKYLECYSKATAPDDETGTSVRFIRSVEEAIGDFERWQEVNETKIPD